MRGAHKQQHLLAPMHALEGFALDDERCFLGCDEALLNSLMHLCNQRGGLVTATGRVSTAKRVGVRVDDLILHQDDKGVVWSLHRVCSFSRLLSRCAPSNDVV